MALRESLDILARNTLSVVFDSGRFNAGEAWSLDGSTQAVGCWQAHTTPCGNGEFNCVVGDARHVSVILCQVDNNTTQILVSLQVFGSLTTTQSIVRYASGDTHRQVDAIISARINRMIRGMLDAN
jgi:hypothetical protein